VAKTSKAKINVGGRKHALRRFDDTGVATHEVIGVGRLPDDGGHGRPLLRQFMEHGEIIPGWTGAEAVARARQRHVDTMAELPAAVNRLQHGEPAIPTIYEAG
jgi:nicotinate phosphoribosyltransferase